MLISNTITSSCYNPHDLTRGRLGASIIPTLCQDSALRVEGGSTSKWKGKGHIESPLSSSFVSSLAVVKIKCKGNRLPTCEEFQVPIYTQSKLLFVLHISWALELFPFLQFSKWMKESPFHLLIFWEAIKLRSNWDQGFRRKWCFT